MEDKELKHEFELERVILFSDAVFAIIITIMILDVKLPEGLKHAKPEIIKEAFKELIPKICAYAGSFALVGIFWARHLKIFKTLRDYDVQLIVRNLFFLFVISMFPFAISTITSGLSLNSYYTVNIYLAIILSAFFSQTLVVAHIVNNKNKLCSTPATVEDTLKWRALRLNYILIPVAVIVVVALNMFDVMPTTIMNTITVYAIALRLISNKYYPSNKPPAIKRLFKKIKPLEIEVPVEPTH